MKYTRELLEPIVAESRSFRQVVTKLGLTATGGSNAYIKTVIIRLGIHTKHFTGNAWSKGLTGSSKPGFQWKGNEHLVLGKNGDLRKSGATLTRALRETGREYKCECCGQLPVWNAKPLVLQVDHEDGKYWNNEPSNLRFRLSKLPHANRNLRK